MKYLVCPKCKKEKMDDCPTKYQRKGKRGWGKHRWGHYCFHCKTWVKEFRKPK